jgi:hypothetical protein
VGAFSPGDLSRSSCSVALEHLDIGAASKGTPIRVKDCRVWVVGEHSPPRNGGASHRVLIDYLECMRRFQHGQGIFGQYFPCSLTAVAQA